MEYITHNRFKGKDLYVQAILITRGKKLIRKGNVLYYQEHPICIYRSECAKKHFSRNDDKQGMIRGDLIEKITFNPLNNDQIDLLLSDKWKKYINPEHEGVIIFGDNLFDEEISILQTLENELSHLE